MPARTAILAAVPSHMTRKMKFFVFARFIAALEVMDALNGGKKEVD